MLPYRGWKLGSVAVLVLSMVLLAASNELAAAGKSDEAQKYADDLKTSKDPAVRATALLELGKLGQLMKSLVKPALPDMVAALQDKDPTVRAAAARAIGMIDPDPKEALPALLKLTKKDQPEAVRMAAIRGLAAMGPTAKDAMKDLRDIMKAEDKDSKVGRAANDAMRSINPKN